MALNSVRKLRHLNLVRHLSSAAPELKHTGPKVRRTAETSPTKHTSQDLCKFYSLPESLCSSLFSLGGIPRSFAEQIKIFNEASVLVRAPMLELVEYLKLAEARGSGPSVRFVVYGEHGTGKSLTLLHALQYAQENDYLIVHIPWALKWFAYPKEVSLSQSKEGMVDLNIDAAMWLRHFQIQNTKWLENSQLVTSQEYVWSPREKSEANIPLTHLIEHGISRVKYASDVVDVLFKEIKKLSSQGVFKTFVCVDGYNCFFTEKTNCKPEDKSKVLPARVTLTQSVLDLVQSDWNNGAIVLAVSPRANLPARRASPLPLYLLSAPGFSSVDPFVPIAVPPLSGLELDALLDYYESKRWLPVGAQEGGPGGAAAQTQSREQIAFVTKRVAQRVYEYVSGK